VFCWGCGFARSGTIYRKRYFDSFWAKNEAKNCKFSRGCGCGYPDGARDHVWRLWRRRFPNNLIQALSKKGVKNITAVSNNAARAKVNSAYVQERPGEACDLLVPRPHANYFQERFAKGEVTSDCVPSRASWCVTHAHGRPPGLLGF